MASMSILARTFASEITLDMARQAAGYRVTGKREGYARAVQQVDWVSDFVSMLSDGDVQGALALLRTEAEQ